MSTLARHSPLARKQPLRRFQMRRRPRRQSQHARWPMTCPPGFHDQMMRRAGNQCERCRSRAWLTLSHKLARSRGGPFTDWNIDVLCAECHVGFVERFPRAAEREGWRVSGEIRRGIYYGGNVAYAAVVAAAREVLAA